MKLIILSLIVLLTSVESSNNESYPSVVVLELFTSQGCSSCPPADLLLKNVKNNDDTSQVLALSYHVDYWNYIGWKDPFSTTEFSDLQRQYGRKFNSSSIYTPQMVINGKEHFVGSNEGILMSKIKSYLEKRAENSVSIFNVIKKDKTFAFEFTVKGDIKNKKLKVVLVIDERTTSISRGENKNRELKNSNIVVEQSIINLDSKTGKGIINISKLVSDADQLSLIALIETSELDIVGGSKVKL